VNSGGSRDLREKYGLPCVFHTSYQAYFDILKMVLVSLTE